jgi:hypothetical protein
VVIALIALLLALPTPRAYAGTTAPGPGAGMVPNQAAQPTISINDVSQVEGNAGTTSFAFTVSLSGASAQTVTVNFSSQNGTATTSDDDFVSNAGTVVFSPGETSNP